MDVRKAGAKSVEPKRPGGDDFQKRDLRLLLESAAKGTPRDIADLVLIMVNESEEPEVVVSLLKDRLAKFRRKLVMT